MHCYILYLFFFFHHSSILLGTKGFDVRRLSEKLYRLDTAKTFEPLEPVRETDIQVHVCCESENFCIALLCLVVMKKPKLEQIGSVSCYLDIFYQTTQSWRLIKQKCVVIKSFASMFHQQMPATLRVCLIFIYLIYEEVKGSSLCLGLEPISPELILVSLISMK